MTLRLLLLLVLASCRGAREPDPVVVLAAASLADVLPAVVSRWDGAPVAFSFDASSRLARQVDAGAPADLLISADEAWMDHLEERGRIVSDTRVTLLGNALVVVVPAGEGEDLSRPADLATVGRVALAAEGVPAGRYARQALRHAGVLQGLTVVEGDDVRTTLAWVARGEVEAGVVYATDARVEPRVEVAFPLPRGSHQPIRYPAAVLRDAPREEPARRLLAFLRSDEAARLFRAAGFEPVPAENP